MLTFGYRGGVHDNLQYAPPLIKNTRYIIESVDGAYLGEGGEAGGHAVEEAVVVGHGHVQPERQQVREVNIPADRRKWLRGYRPSAISVCLQG